MLAAYAIVVMRKDNKILLLKRGKHAKFAPEHYCLVGGRLEQGETFRQSLIRELYEEVGVRVSEQDLHFVHVFHRKGKEHELVVAVFECSRWQNEPFNKEPDKHENMIWVVANVLPQPMVPAHQQVLALIAQGIAYSEQSNY